MKNKRNLLFMLSGILLGITIMGIVICFTIGKLNLVDKVYTAKVNTTKEEAEAKEELENREVIEESTKEIPVYFMKEEVEVIKEVVKEQVVIVKEEQEQIKKEYEEKANSKTETSIDIKTEDSNKTKEEISKEVVSFVEKIETEILTEENVNKVLQAAKTSFITITDFIFYGAEINGYTFDELTEEAKAKVIAIAIEIDAAIEEVRPGYKDEIKLGVSNLIDKATIKYLEVSEKICTEMGEVACNQAKKDLEVMKESFGITLDVAKVLTQKGLESLKNWYEIFRESK